LEIEMEERKRIENKTQKRRQTGKEKGNLIAN
jgi:hypothetical protein